MTAHATFAVLFVFITQSVLPQEHDSLICQRLFDEAEQHHIARLPMSKVVVWAGKQFLGSPYAPQTLEVPAARVQEGKQDDERLIVNLREFDCVTLTESVLALARCIRKGNRTMDAYRKTLQDIRYRDGVIEGYPSRLHYFSEWILNNDENGNVRNMTAELGGETLQNPLNWMTSHRTAYRQLRAEHIFEAIGRIERRLSGIPRQYISKEKFDSVSEMIQEGDIIAFVSNRSGLDVEHVGIAVRQANGALHLLHASDRNRNVVLSQEPLEQYLQGLSRCSGVMVARPEEIVRRSESRRQSDN